MIAKFSPDRQRNTAGPLRVLFVEDNPLDVELSLLELKRAGLEVQGDIVQSLGEFSDRIQSEAYDLVVADYTLRGWTGLDALDHLQKQAKDIPFILVTGTLGEELAVQCIKRGAMDYVLKDRLARLPVAVRHAMEEKHHREERALLEEQLRQTQKMEALGRLAGGITHDFNNLLTIILSYSEIGMERPGASKQELEGIEEIKKAATRAASLTRQLLAFSRKEVPEPKVIDLNEVLGEMGKMLGRVIGKDVELRIALQPDLGNVKAAPGQIEQVIMNLAVNARDAMPQGGVLTFQTASVEIDHTLAKTRPSVTQGRYAVLAASDTGAGMDAETKAHLFEPFFTTKEADKGTGLGLSTVYGIVKQGGGFIEVHSELGQGSTFKIYLPVTDDPDEEEKADVACH